MANCGEHKNPLKSGGAGQSERLIDALKPGYARVDEHEYADWIVFAGEFAGFLNYFNSNDTVSGDWRPFFTSDISARLGNVAVQNIDVYREEIKKRFDILRGVEYRYDIPKLKSKLNELFSALLTLSLSLDQFQLNLPADTNLKNTLINLIKTRLAPALRRLISYYNEASGHYLSPVSESQWKILGKQLTDAGYIIRVQGLSAAWIIDSSSDWKCYVDKIAADQSVFSSALADDTPPDGEYLRLRHAANHNLFSGIFDEYLLAFTRIIKDAKTELTTTLSKLDGHQPHYALFLSFLRLFRFAQDEANTITKRHLDFYYKDVLRLKPKEALPNHAHVLVELAKQVDSYLLLKGTSLKAGKDSLGNEVQYTLDVDTTFNKAKVSDLSALYLASADDSIKDFSSGTPVITQNNDGRLFAAPIMNSQDGLGAELNSVNKEWHPYVHKTFKNARLTEIAMPKAAIGFAVASHYLYLTEGNREVTVKITTTSPFTLARINVACYLTTAKGWLKVGAILQPVSSPPPTAGQAQISFTLTGDLPAIENYNPSVHGGTFDCALPLLKVYLVQEDHTPYLFSLLRDIQITSVEVLVNVGKGEDFIQPGIKSLLLAGDSGHLDAGKPFMPFGSNPSKDASFIVGNKEAFSKKNTDIKLNIEWSNYPSNSNEIDYNPNATEGEVTPRVDVNVLSSGVWNPLGNVEGTNVDLLPSARVSIGLNLSSVPVHFFAAYDSVYLPFDSKTNRGFINFVLKRDFGYKAYLDDLTKYQIQQSNENAEQTITDKPIEPYNPIIKSLYLSYNSHQSTNLAEGTETAYDNREIRFFHVLPFGAAEQHQYLNNKNGIQDSIYLFPQFKHLAIARPGATATEPKHHSGEFYIGLEHLKGGQAVNILFQFLEGSGNPRIAKPDNHVTWSYLSNNFWREFAALEVSDNTLGLLQSGIISFAIPIRATTDNTLLPAGKIWIRAAVETSAEAIPKLISVDAQAAIATFTPLKNADDFLNTPLAPGTISKLKTPVTAVKKINQLYPAFGGRPREDEEHFNIRVSERLRHKARAVTIWDYERLVLEAFPEIYKVKCLNHTSVCPDNGTERINEQQPGHVLVITIPVIHYPDESNPLKPYTNQDVLTRIEQFLKDRVSGFVTVRTLQPLFEEVGISFSLQLYEQYRDFTFYANMLQQEITQFLSPWAGNQTADIRFGGKFYKSSLINFIEERYYVDYITDVVLSHRIDDTTTTDPAMEEITASTARSILVSMPAIQHKINPIQ